VSQRGKEYASTSPVVSRARLHVPEGVESRVCPGERVNVETFCMREKVIVERVTRLGKLERKRNVLHLTNTMQLSRDEC
jgi:hypothetical protein